MDQELARRKVDAVVCDCKAGANGEEYIGLLEPSPDRFGRGAVGCSERERVALVNGALARHRGHDGDLSKFGEFSQLFRGTSMQNALTGPDRGHPSVE